MREEDIRTARESRSRCGGVLKIIVLLKLGVCCPFSALLRHRVFLPILEPDDCQRSFLGRAWKERSCVAASPAGVLRVVEGLLLRGLRAGWSGVLLAPRPLHCFVRGSGGALSCSFPQSVFNRPTNHRSL
ncbi:unnamed protein product [Ectocarpus sp. 8 AP-2014]